MRRPTVVMISVVRAGSSRHLALHPNDVRYKDIPALFKWQWLCDVSAHTSYWDLADRLSNDSVRGKAYDSAAESGPNPGPDRALGDPGSVHTRWPIFLFACML